MQALNFQKQLTGRMAFWLAATIIVSMLALIACGDSNSSETVASQADENKLVVGRFIEEFKNKANHDIVDELLTDDFVHHLKDPRLPPGRPAIKLLGQSIAGGFPVVKATVEELLAVGDKVIERTSVAATHTGEFNGIPATGNKVNWTEIHIYRLIDGNIVELWSEIDLLALLTQLGALPGA